MFSLLYGLWEYIFRKEELRILVLGLDKSGKTTVLERLKELYTDVPGLEPEAILPTVGLNVGRMEACNASLIMWDLGGQLGLRGIWEKYFADAHGLLYVVDSADSARLEEAQNALARSLASRDLEEAPLLVVANKQDRADAQAAEVLKQQLGPSRADTRTCKVQAACALNGDGLREGLQWLIDEIRTCHRTELIRRRTGAL